MHKLSPHLRRGSASDRTAGPFELNESSARRGPCASREPVPDHKGLAFVALLFSLLLVVSPVLAAVPGPVTACPTCIPNEPEYFAALYSSEELEYPEEVYFLEELWCPEEWSCLEDPVIPDESGVMDATASRVGAGSATTSVTPKSTGDERVYCVETGKVYSSIQKAIDDASTLDGYTLVVDPGVYKATVVVTKRLIITGNDTGGSPPVIQLTNHDAIYLLADGCTLQRLVLSGIDTVPDDRSGFAGIDVRGNGCIVSDIVIEGFHQGVKITGVNNTRISNLTAVNSPGEGSCTLHVSAAHDIVVDRIRSDQACYGVLVDSASSNVTLSNSVFSGNSKYGIYSRESELLNFDNVTSDGADYGAWIQDCRHVGLSGLAITNSTRSGMILKRTSDVVCTYVSSTGNVYSGLFMQNNTLTEIRSSRFEENGNHGIYADTADRLTVSDTKIAGNGDCGLVAWDTTLPVISKVVADGNGKTGIAMVRSVQPSLDNLSSTGNVYSGLALWNTTLTEITSSRFEENGNDGIYADGGEGFTLSNLTCTGNGMNGICAFDGVGFTISNSTCTDNGNDGIGMYPSNMSSCDNLTCRDNFDAGFWVQNCTQFRAEDSVFEHNGRYGLYLGGCREVNVTRNCITGNNARSVEEGSGLNLDGADDLAGIRVWDNVFDNTVNVRLINVSVPVNFSVGAVPGPSIAGGPLVGGNYWHQPDGNGWSQTHPDNDGDGFCDEAWHIDGSTWDLLPLNMAGPGPVPDFTAEPLNGSAPLEVRFTDLTCGDVTAWNWSFGDGSWFDTADPALSGPVHTYTRAGLFMVSLVTENSNYTLTKEKAGYISVAMVTNFTAEPTDGLAPLEVQFTDQSLGEPMCWNWSFGDGTWFNTTLPFERNATHRYTRAGNYTVRLLTSNEEAWDCEEKAEYILIPMAADFYAEPLNGTPPLEVQFTDQSLGEPMCWNWSFGDGTWFNTTLPFERNATHTYTHAGTFTVRLYADNGAARDCEEKAEYIQIPMSAFFTTSGRSGYAPLEVAFTDQSTGTPVNWTWDFGDGATSDEQHPVHTYATPGRYHVKLTVESVYGAAATATREGWITVYPPGSGGGGGDNFVKVRMEDYSGSTLVVNATVVPPVSNPTQPSPVSIPSGIRETLTLLPSGGTDRIPSVYIAGGLLVLVLIAGLALAFLRK